MAVALFSGSLHASVVACPDLSGEAEEGDTKIATTVGLAVLYPTYPPSGVDVAVECLVRQFDTSGADMPGKTGALGRSLIVIMVIDPQRFFGALERMPRSPVNRWLHGSLEAAAGEYIGSCSVPDLFDQARKAIVDVKLPSARQRQLRDEIQTALRGLHCRTVG